jgi:hypothetical protein
MYEKKNLCLQTFWLRPDSKEKRSEPKLESRASQAIIGPKLKDDWNPIPPVVSGAEL